MGACLSSHSSQSASKAKIVRVVQLDGCVQDFSHPVPVSEVLAGRYPPQHLVCTPAQLLSGSSNTLKHETLLELGQIYFRLPYYLFQSDVSPMDLASMAKKLSTIAKKCHTNKKDASKKATNFLPTSNSPSSSPNRGTTVGLGHDRLEDEFFVMEKENPCKAGSWKPVLCTIREGSINRSGSDLEGENWES